MDAICGCTASAARFARRSVARMTAQADPYVKVYYRILEDPKFEKVYGNDAALATWLRLLIVADAMHPAPAPIPMGAKIKPLVECGLVDLLPGNHYRMHGLAAEREKRAQPARTAAASRWGMREHPERIRNADAEPMLARAPLHSAPLRSDPIRSAPASGIPTLREPPSNELMLQQAYGVLADRTASEEAHRKAQAFIDGQRKSA